MIRDKHNFFLHCISFLPLAFLELHSRRTNQGSLSLLLLKSLLRKSRLGQLPLWGSMGQRLNSGKTENLGSRHLGEAFK